MKKLMLSLITTLALANTINLNPGWNLVGTSENIDLNQINNSDIKVIWKWDNGEWKLFSTDENILSLSASNNYEKFSNINPNEGFWVYADRETTISDNVSTPSYNDANFTVEDYFNNRYSGYALQIEADFSKPENLSTNPYIYVEQNEMQDDGNFIHKSLEFTDNDGDENSIKLERKDKIYGTISFDGNSQNIKIEKKEDSDGNVENIDGEVVRTLNGNLITDSGHIGDDSWSDKSTVLNIEPVSSVLGIPVGDENRIVYKITEKDTYLDDDDWENDGDWADDYNNNLSDYVATHPDVWGSANNNLQIADNGKFKDKRTGEIINDSNMYWKIEDNILKIRAYDDYDMKFDNGKVYDNWKGDLEYFFVNLTLDEAQAIFDKLHPNSGFSLDLN